MFSPIPGARAIPSTGYYGAVPVNTPRAAVQNNINIRLTAGMRILIGGVMSAGGSGTLSAGYNFYFTGGISLLAV